MNRFLAVFMLLFLCHCEQSRRQINFSFVSGVTKTDPCEGSELTLLLVSGTDMACHGEKNISIDVEALGGSGNYEFFWKNESGQIISKKEDLHQVAAGEYTVKVKDTQCQTEATKKFTTSELGPLSLVIDDITPATCRGLSVGGAQVKALGGSGQYLFFWNKKDGERILSRTSELKGVSNGSYVLTLVDEVCPHNLRKEIEIPAPPNLQVSTVSQTEKSCQNLSESHISVEVTGGSGSYSYTWKDSSHQLISTEDSLEGVKGGDYTLTVEDEECSEKIEKNYTLSNHSSLALTLESIEGSSCHNSQDGSASATVTGGSGEYSYEWTSNSKEILSTDQTIETLGLGDYTLTVTDKTCKDSVSQDFSIEGPSELATVLSNVVDTSCQGAYGITIETETTGGSGDYSYSWKLADREVSTGANLYNASGGTYTLEVRDESCNESLTKEIVTVELSQLSLIHDNSTQASCPSSEDGELYFSVSGGSGNYSYSLVNSAGSEVSVEEDNTSLKAGEYSMTVKDETCNESLSMSLNLESLSDEDCDGLLAEEDCDDNNPDAPSNDLDCDGILSDEDCQDDNPNAPSQDADCDSVLTDEDCDDNNPDAPLNDADCDGVLTDEDCDDDNPDLPSLEDQDCDGYVGEEDCNDENPGVPKETGVFGELCDCEGNTINACGNCGGICCRDANADNYREAEYCAKSSEEFVTFYNETNYSGFSFTRTAYKNDETHIPHYGSFNDKLRSLKIGQYRTVKLFQNISYGSACGQYITGNYPTLNSCRKGTSSYRIRTLCVNGDKVSSPENCLCEDESASNFNQANTLFGACYFSCEVQDGTNCLCEDGTQKDLCGICGGGNATFDVESGECL